MKRRTFRGEGAHVGRALADAVAAELGLPVADARRLVEV
ncbi:RluA family pseudouridine synthase, partial [Corallococcus sp. CA053C]